MLPLLVLIHYLGKGNTNIVITGRMAVGKSLLHDRMRRATEYLEYEIPETSRNIESSVLTVGGWGTVVRVIPGQGIQERDLGLHEAFSKHDNLDGVIYVVDWGYTQPRDEITSNYLLESGYDSIDRLREFNLKKELEDFSYICQRIKESHSRCKHPRWILIAVNKSDLFINDLDEAKKYYHPALSSPFTEILNRLLFNIGTSNISCDTVPVSSWDVDFSWNGQTIKSNIGGTNNSRALIKNFMETVAKISK
ncbi:MAG: 50S ribosome-binding GTPase [Magnetococcales bacterium]|nr:50S ribosome-binding GTPase [Magnetococcales bacterium]